jgi:hypothetical protein
MMEQTTRFAVNPDGTGPQVLVGAEIPEGMVEVFSAPPDAGASGYDFTANAWLPSAVPNVYPGLTARQLRLMLLSIGITPAMVDAEIAAIADPPDRTAAQIEWEYASSYERTHPLIDQMAAAFSLPPEQVDALWIAAADL